MIIIKKTLDTDLTIPQLIEKIVMQGMLEESNFKIRATNHFDVKLTPEQIDWINEFVYPSNKIVHLNGERCSGRTSIGIGMVLASALFQADSVSMIMTSSEQMLQHHQRKVLDYLATFCEVFSLGELVAYRNKKEIELVNGSRIYLETNKPCALTGRQLTNLFLDLHPCPRLTDPCPSLTDLDEELMSCFYPCLYPSGKLIVSLGA